MKDDLKFGSTGLMVFNIESFGPVVASAVASLIVSFRGSVKTLKAIEGSDLSEYPGAVKAARERVEDLYKALYYICKIWGMESPVKDLYEGKRSGGKFGNSLIDVQA